MNMNLKLFKVFPFNRLRGVSYTAETISYLNISVNIQQKSCPLQNRNGPSVPLMGSGGAV